MSTFRFHEDVPQASWEAVGHHGGGVHVAHHEKGEWIVLASVRGMQPKVAWLTTEANQPPILFVATGRNLQAFRIVKTETRPEAESEDSVQTE